MEGKDDNDNFKISSWCYKTFLEEILILQKLRNKKSVVMSEPALKCERNPILSKTKIWKVYYF